MDVVVLGGGLAGLTGALQLKRLRPATRVLLVEKRERPVEPTAFKVGESIAEVAAYYLKDVIGLEEYLREHHLRKMALRIFCSADGNEDLASRVEYGSMKYSKLMNYHLDRGRIENDLWEMAAAEGIEVREATHVSTVELGEGEDDHVVVLGRGADATRVRTRWILDASGRVGLLRHKLGLEYELPIDVNACWFRTPDRLELDTWSDDAAWREQVPGGTRWKSTTSVVGEGYWIWIINLASGATSVGIVADPRFHAFERIRRYDAARAWMEEHEPQLAAHLPKTEDGLLDFGKRKRYSYGCSRAFSTRRWCLTGEAALFLDPLYSTGHDFTAIGNTLACDLIVHALDGEEPRALKRRIRSHNRFFLAVLQSELPIFAGQLEVFRDPQATGTKFIWDNISYFSLLLAIFKNGLITDVDFVDDVLPVLRRHMEMNAFMQEQFRLWSRADWDSRAAGVPIGTDHLWDHNFHTPLKRMDADVARQHLDDSIALLHTLSREMVTRMYEATGRPVPEAPYDAPPEIDAQLLHWAGFEGDTTRPTLDTEAEITWQVHHRAPAVVR